MNRRITINEDERSRILGLHENRKSQEWSLLFEAGPDMDPNVIPGVTDTPATTTPATTTPATTTPATTTTPKTGALNRQVVQGAPGDPYQYKGESGKYYYAFKKDGTNPKWIEQKNPDGVKAIQSKILDTATPQAVTSNEPKMTTLKPSEIGKSEIPTGLSAETLAKVNPELKSSGNPQIDTWLTTDMGKAFSKITDPKQKEAMMDYLEKNDPVISSLGKDTVRPILLGAVSADTKLGRFGQKVGQGMKGFAKGFTGK